VSPDDYVKCETVTNDRCDGDPYSSEYFTVYGDMAVERHSSLFVLYAFDSMHTSLLKTPTLTVTDCVFAEFLN
jgi:hypothetical protein